MKFTSCSVSFLLGVASLPSSVAFVSPSLSASVSKASALFSEPDLNLKTSDDLQYTSLTRGFNQRWTADNCQGVYIIKNTEEARAALDDALDKFPGGVKIKSGGHCYEDFVTNGGTTAILDVAAMKDWGYDTDLDEGNEEKGYFLSAGETNWGAFEKVYKELNAVLPGGSCYSVGLGGHISGGGDGIMSRKYGCTVDVLTGVEMIVRDGDTATIKYVGDNSVDEDDQALFWAQRGGGGGNFGIITKYYFKALPEAPKGAIMSNIAFNWSDITSPQVLKDILDWYVAFAKRDDNRDSSGKFPISHSAAGQAQMLLHTAYWNETGRLQAIEDHHQWEKELAAIIPKAVPLGLSAGHGVGFIRNTAPRREKFRLGLVDPTELSDSMTDLPFYDSTQTMNPSGSTQRGKYKSSYMLKEFPMYQVETMYKWLNKIQPGLTEAEMKQSLIQVDCFGGKINDMESWETPIAQRNYVVKCQYQTYWSDEDKDDEHLGWISGFYDEMYEPYGGVPDPDYRDESDEQVFEGCYYNYPDVDLNDKVGLDGALKLYFLDNYKDNTIPSSKFTLSYVKGRWDPNNIFNHAQSIPVPDSVD